MISYFYAKNISRMKKSSLVFYIVSAILILISSCSYSQAGKLPPFQMIRADGRLFTAHELPIGKPIVIIYFSPECEECQKITEELVSKIEDYWKASIAMVTYLPVNTLPDFISKYKLNIYTNIYVGTEGNTFFLRRYYGIQRFPFIALYNKDGNLIKAFYNETNLSAVTKSLKDL
jgi:hypothetical protein